MVGSTLSFQDMLGPYSVHRLGGTLVFNVSPGNALKLGLPGAEKRPFALQLFRCLSGELFCGEVGSQSADCSLRKRSSSRPAGLGARVRALSCPCLDHMQEGASLTVVFKGPVATGECLRQQRLQEERGRR